MHTKFFLLIFTSGVPIDSMVPLYTSIIYFSNKSNYFTMAAVSANDIIIIIIIITVIVLTL
jgi:hypothetical protein